MDPQYQQPTLPDQPKPLSSPTPQPSSTAYLDSIASVQPAKKIRPWMLWSLIGGGMLLLIIVGSLILSSGGPSQADRLIAVVYRIQALEKLSSDSSKQIQDSTLRALNGTMLSVLTGADQESSVPLANNNIKTLPSVKKTNPISVEYMSLASKLDDARLNVNFDRVYAREIAYQLATIHAEMGTIYKNTRSTSLKSYLDKTDKNLQPLQKQFQDYNNSQS